MDNIAFNKVHKDVRGEICSILFRGKAFELFEIVKGAMRGGHYHVSNAQLIVLTGQILYREMFPGNNESETQKILNSGDSIKIEAGKAHLVTAITDSLAIEFREGNYEVTDYLPYRKLVKDYLDKHAI